MPLAAPVQPYFWGASFSVPRFKSGKLYGLLWLVELRAFQNHLAVFRVGCSLASGCLVQGFCIVGRVRWAASIATKASGITMAIKCAPVPSAPPPEILPLASILFGAYANKINTIVKISLIAALCAMLKNIVLVTLIIFLALTLGGAWFALRDIVLAEPKYSVPNWTETETDVLNRAYLELGRVQKVPLHSYPYEIQKTNEGYTVKFQTVEFLRLRKSLLLDEEIYDGCVFYHFDQSMKLIRVFYCG